MEKLRSTRRDSEARQKEPTIFLESSTKQSTGVAIGG